MKRVLVLLSILIFLLLPATLFADDPETFISTYSNCFTVNVASQNFPTHKLTSEWEGTPGATTFYKERELLATVGIRGIEANYDEYVEFSIEYISISTEEWCYVLNGNDTRYMRPFGIDIFSRRRLLNGGDHDELGSNGKYRAHLGYQTTPAGENLQPSATVIVEPEVVNTCNALWWDIALVFNPSAIEDGVLNYDGKKYYLTVGDTYTATIKVTVKSYDKNNVVDVEQSNIINLTGYYDGTTQEQQTSNNDMISNLTVSRRPAAESIDIASLYESNISVDVADYSFVTNTRNDDNEREKNNVVYMFLSSSRNGAVEGEEFFLRHTNANGTVSNRDNAHNAVRFTAAITSTRGSSKVDSSTRTVTFDGTDYWGESPENYLVIPALYQVGPNGNKPVSWPDSGTISITIPDNQIINGTEVTTEGLFAGLYTANIYVHVVVWK